MNKIITEETYMDANDPSYMFPKERKEAFDELDDCKCEKALPIIRELARWKCNTGDHDRNGSKCIACRAKEALDE